MIVHKNRLDNCWMNEETCFDYEAKLTAMGIDAFLNVFASYALVVKDAGTEALAYAHSSTFIYLFTCQSLAGHASPALDRLEMKIALYKVTFDHRCA